MTDDKRLSESVDAVIAERLRAAIKTQTDDYVLREQSDGHWYCEVCTLADDPCPYEASEVTHRPGCYIGAQIAALSTIERLKEAREWRPIESAPKDGARILVWDPEAAALAASDPELKDAFEPRKIVKWFDTGDAGHMWVEMGSHKRIARPTYWQPLPPPPSPL